jgi:hypothetical protein
MVLNGWLESTLDCFCKEGVGEGIAGLDGHGSKWLAGIHSRLFLQGGRGG